MRMMIQLQTTFGANFKQLCLERAVARTQNSKIKRNFFNPFFVTNHAVAQ